jgi:hypothetical protein
VLCNLQAGPPLCVEEIVTDSSMSGISFQSCQIQGQIGAASWMQQNPAYRANWRLDRYKCVPGHYEIRGRV